MAEMIRRLVAMREAEVSALESWVPSYPGKIWRMERTDANLGLDTFINLMTALRCEVVVVPLGRLGSSGWYKLNDFPDNEGNVLVMPEAVKKGHRKRRTGTECGPARRRSISTESERNECETTGN